MSGGGPSGEIHWTTHGQTSPPDVLRDSPRHSACRSRRYRPHAPRVQASSDGVPCTPKQYAELLGQLAAQGKAKPDNCSLGGAVEELELRMARILGKEAIWMATGTIPNQIAVRTLAGTRHRVLVQAESHLYRDCGDCCQTLSGLNMVRLAPGKATFTLTEVEAGPPTPRRAAWWSRAEDVNDALAGVGECWRQCGAIAGLGFAGGR